MKWIHWLKLSLLLIYRCVCGHHKLAHMEEATEPTIPSTPSWLANKHTTTAPTDAFGQIYFQGGACHSSKAQVCIIDCWPIRLNGPSAIFKWQVCPIGNYRYFQLNALILSLPIVMPLPCWFTKNIYITPS